MSVFCVPCAIMIARNSATVSTGADLGGGGGGGVPT